MSKVYYCSIQKTIRIVAENEEEARDEFIHRFDLDYTEVKVSCKGKAPSNFERRAMNGYGESCLLDQGITQGIV